MCVRGTGNRTSRASRYDRIPPSAPLPRLCWRSGLTDIMVLTFDQRDAFSCCVQASAGAATSLLRLLLRIARCDDISASFAALGVAARQSVRWRHLAQGADSCSGRRALPCAAEHYARRVSSRLAGAQRACVVRAQWPRQRHACRVEGRSAA
jgi:hypothetical protein